MYRNAFARLWTNNSCALKTHAQPTTVPVLFVILAANGKTEEQFGSKPKGVRNSGGKNFSRLS